MVTNTHVQDCRRKKIFASFVALGLGSFVTPAIAANIVVKACSDADIFHPPLILYGLRSSVADANDGDTIDMTELSGCTITLTDGEIPITVNNLTFKGPPGHPVTINGNYSNRIFDHTGTGTVTLSYFSLTNGYSGPVDTYTYTGTGYGGCIFSKGSLSLGHSTVSACVASYGSAIFAVDNISLNRSVVTGNTALNTAGAVEMDGNLYAKYSQINNNFGYGITSHGNVELIGGTTINGNSRGGVFARGYVALTASTVDGNAGRGIYSGGPVTVNGSTISNNSSSSPFGGGIAFYVGKYTTAKALTITNSTISGNSVHGQSTRGGGFFVYCSDPTTPIKISNSTIAYNSAQYKGGGIYAKNCSFTLQSSIIADNSVANINEQPYSDADVSSCAVMGSNNLVGVLSFPLPGTLTGPAGLTPLDNNGGRVKTHALLENSPAINAGNNFLNLAGDERGLPRVVGPAADIGAYEQQVNDDEIFYNGFQ